MECGLGFCPLLTSVGGDIGRVIGREKVQGGGDQRPSQGSFLPWEEVSQESRVTLECGVDMEEGAKRSCQTTVKTSPKK